MDRMRTSFWFGIIVGALAVLTMMDVARAEEHPPPPVRIVVDDTDWIRTFHAPVNPVVDDTDRVRTFRAPAQQHATTSPPLPADWPRGVWNL